MSAFMVEQRTIDLIAPLMLHDFEQENKPMGRLDEICRSLVRMNYAAYFARYPRETFETTKVVKAIKYTPRKKPTDIELFKAIDCYLYQCSEGEIDQTPLYNEVKAKQAELAKRIIRQLSEYQKADFWN